MLYGGGTYGDYAYGEDLYTPLDTSAFQAFLAEVPSARVWLLEIDALSLAKVGSIAEDYGDAGYGELAYGDSSGATTGGTVTLRYASQGFTTKSTDSPASTYYDGRLMADVNVDRRIASSDGIGGLAVVFGDLRLVNRDGALDLLTASYALDGRQARVLIGRATDARAAFGQLFTGVVNTVTIGEDLVQLNLTDGASKLVVPVSPNRYAGSGGLEGGTDLQGKPKPKCWGHAYNVPAPLVDSANLIYQVHDGAISDVPAVYDRQVVLTKVAGAPAAGQYSVNTAAGTFTLGATPAGEVTADVLGDASGAGYVNTTPDIVQRILVNQAGLYSTELDPSTFVNLKTVAGQEVGIWIGPEENRTCGEVADELLAGVGAFGGFSRAGTFSVGQVDSALGIVSQATYTTLEILSLVREPLPASVDPVIFRALVGWQKNYAVQADVAAGVTAARRTFAAAQWRVSKKEDTSIQSRHLQAKEYGPSASLYAVQADGDTEAQRRMNLWGVERGLYRATLKLPALIRDMGQVVTLVYPRFGFGGGLACRVVGHAVKGTSVELLVLV